MTFGKPIEQPKENEISGGGRFGGKKQVFPDSESKPDFRDKKLEETKEIVDFLKSGAGDEKERKAKLQTLKYILIDFPFSPKKLNLNTEEDFKKAGLSSKDFDFDLGMDIGAGKGHWPS